MENSTIHQLLQDLKAPDETVREQATAELWRIWFAQKGELGLELLRRAHFLLEVGEIDQAEAILTDIIHTHPDFAEAWNRRAVLYYSQKAYAQSKRDCEKAVELNPYHFGAWHGLGLCLASLGKYLEAIQAFRQALAIQPHALVNQKLILECTARLNQV